MRVHTLIELDIITGEILREMGYDWSGPVMEMKKGREQQDQVIAQEQQQANADTAKQNSQYGLAQPFESSLFATKPGELSPLAKQNYAANVNNIVDTYNRLGSVGQRNLAARGFGSAPSGFDASLRNSLARSEGTDIGSAYTNAQNQTYGQGLAGLQYAGNLQNLYNPTPTLNAASEAALRRSQMGSTLGDVVGGLGGLASGVGSLFVPGGSSFLGIH